MVDLIFWKVLACEFQDSRFKFQGFNFFIFNHGWTRIEKLPENVSSVGSPPGGKISGKRGKSGKRRKDRPLVVDDDVRLL